MKVHERNLDRDTEVDASAGTRSAPFPQIRPTLVIDVSVAYKEQLSTTLFALGAEHLEARNATILTRGSPGRITLIARFGVDALAHSALKALETSIDPRLLEVARVGPHGREILSALQIDEDRSSVEVTVPPPMSERAHETWVALVMRQLE